MIVTGDDRGSMTQYRRGEHFARTSRYGVECPTADLVIRDHPVLRRQAQDREHFRGFVLQQRDQRRCRLRRTTERSSDNHWLAVMILANRISNRQLSKFHRLRLHGRVLRMCALWFLRELRNPTRTARAHERSAAPAREWFFAAAVIRCTWHSRRSRFTAAKPLPPTPVATGPRGAIQDGARNWERLRDGDDLDRAVRFSAGDAAVRDSL